MEVQKTRFYMPILNLCSPVHTYANGNVINSKIMKLFLEKGKNILKNSSSLSHDSPFPKLVQLNKSNS